MKNKIFSLPIVALGIILYGGGYYWGASLKQSKIISIQLDEKYQTSTTASTSNNNLPPPAIIAATSTPKLQAANAASEPVVIKKTAPAPISNPPVSPAKKIPTPVTPTPVTPTPVTPTPVVAEPSQEPVTAPVPTTKAS